MSGRCSKTHPKKAFTELNALNQSHLRISRLLDTPKGELKFQDVVVSLCAESAFAAFEAERKQIQGTIDTVVLTVDELESKLEELRSSRRTKAIPRQS